MENPDKKKKKKRIIIIILLLLLLLLAFLFMFLKSNYSLSKTPDNLISKVQGMEPCTLEWKEEVNKYKVSVEMYLDSLEKDSYEYNLYYDLLLYLNEFDGLQPEDSAQVQAALKVTTNQVEKILTFRGETYE